MRQTKIDQKQAVAKRPRVAAARIGDKIIARPRTKTDCAYEKPLVSTILIRSKCTVMDH